MARFCVSGTNARGERVKKGQSGGSATTTEYVYDEGGQLLGDYTSTGAAQNEYIYLDSQPIALVTGGSLYYVEADHLGTPRQVINPTTNTVAWSWSLLGNTFGATAPSPTSVTLNLRFPGQYADAETGLNYNYFRDYEPGTGRYVESDPLGLSGGIDTYAYGADAPLYLTDRLGLSPCGGDCCKNHPWRQGNGEFASGGVECCGGKMVPCVNPKICEGKDQSGKPVAYPSDACKIVTDCARKHEQFHIDNGHPASCSGDGTPPFQPPFDNGSGECAAYRNEVPCLNISKCTSHLCEDIIKQVQSFKILNRQKFCNAAGM